MRAGAHAGGDGRLDRWIDGACLAIEAVMALFLAIMVVLVFGNVVMRYGFNSSILVSEELSRWLFIWITFLGAIVAMRRHAHLGMDMLVSRLPPLGKKLCLALSQLLMLYIVWLLFDGSLTQARINKDMLAPVTGLPVSVTNAACLVFAVCAALILLLDFYRLVTGRLADDDLVAIQESEEADALALALAERATDRAIERGTDPATGERRP